MFEEIKQILVEQLTLDPEKITPEAKLEADLGVNSLELAELAFNCEEKYGVVFKDEDLHTLITVGDIVEYIGKNKK